MNNAELLARQIDDTRDWTLKLLNDFEGDDWSFQPLPGVGHALWLCGHLACAQDLLVHRRCLNKPGLVDDSFSRHFSIGGPVKSAQEHDYPSPEVIRGEMNRVHKATLADVLGMSDAVLAEPAFGGDGKPHPHYSDKAGAVAHCCRHEAFHAGQIALIRRLQGKSFLR